ncbi:fumarate reductase cytochrome b subunit [Zoogloea sp. LCSB751]|uniref:fumarate reductase cytochrome b subunit n=1 Tax=Zoogloea sp. LCSB751 TaxID=1965277 RepID=UPI0009A4F76F|nr:fumarate reductase cytochrome b subunit [Zoogloea sp. LCSB751]
MSRMLERSGALPTPAGSLAPETPLPVAAAPSAPLHRRSRWPARLDLLQSASGLFLALFLVAHMFFVSSILISQDAFYTVARFFEGAYFLATPQPWIVSCVVGGVLAVFVLHAWLALRKFPANFRQYKAFAEHRAGLRHDDTGLWWIQLWTGFALFFLASIHLYGMLVHPELIGPYESADRVWTGSMWPLYLLLLFAAEIHGSIGLYRLALKWDWLPGRDPVAGRRRLRALKTAFSLFFIALGLVSLLAYVRLGIAHADRAGERYVPSGDGTPANVASGMNVAPAMAPVRRGG